MFTTCPSPRPTMLLSRPLRLLSLQLSLLLVLASGLAAADQLRIQGVLFRDGDSVVRLLQHAGPPLWISDIGRRCVERYCRHCRSCRYRRPAERWTYIDDGKEIRITVVDDTIDAIDWKFEDHSW